MKASNNIQTEYTKNAEHQSRKYPLPSWLGQASNDSVWCNQKWNPKLNGSKCTHDVPLKIVLGRQFN